MEELTQQMSARELSEWIAYQEVYGPVLPHDRMDFGFSQLAFILASAFSKRRPRWRDALPPWLRNRSASDPRKLEQTLRMWANEGSMAAQGPTTGMPEAEAGRAHD